MTPIDPCGCVVDVLRSCYTSAMRFSPNGVPVPVRWFFVDEDKPIVPYAHPFGSQVWEDDWRILGDDGLVGEVLAPKPPWNNGKPLAEWPAKMPAGPQEIWEHGAGPIWVGLEKDMAGVPLACSGKPPTFAVAVNAGLGYRVGLMVMGDLGMAFSGAKLGVASNPIIPSNVSTYIEWSRNPSWSFDTDHYWSATYPQRLTIPQDGYYLVGAGLNWGGLDADVGILIESNVNGNLAYQRFRGALSPGTGHSLAVMAYFRKDEIVRVRADQNSGLSTFIIFGGQITSFWIIRLSTAALTPAFGTPICGATVGGDVDGENDTFTLEHVPKPDSLCLYVNGVRQQEGDEADYTLDGDTITFDADAIPQEGDDLQADYRY